MCAMHATIIGCSSYLLKMFWVLFFCIAVMSIISQSIEWLCCVFHYSPINWFKCLTSKIYHAPCRFPITCRCPMRRYMNASPRFSRTVVFVLAKKSSALETCTSLNPFFPLVIINICSNIHFFYLFLKRSLWGCII